MVLLLSSLTWSWLYPPRDKRLFKLHREFAVIVERYSISCCTIVSYTIILVWVKYYADKPLIINIWDVAILFLHAGKGHLNVMPEGARHH